MTPATPTRQTQGTLLALSALAIMTGAAVSAALPAMQTHFQGVPPTIVKMSFTVVGLMIALTAPISGLLTDRLGRKPVLVIALALYAIGGGSVLIAQSIPAVIAGRALLGLAVAATMTATGALVNDYFRGQALARFVSLQFAFNNFIGAIMYPIGGMLTALSWRAPFSVYLIGFALIPFALRLPRPETHHAHPDEQHQKPDWRQLSLVYLAALGYMTTFFVIPVQGPFLLRDAGATPTTTGVLLGVFTIMAALSSFAYSRRAGTFNPTRSAAAGMFLMAVSWWWLAHTSTMTGIIPALLLGGIGAGIGMLSLTLWQVTLTPPAWRGRITAGMSSAFFLGQFLSPLVLAPGQAVTQAFTWAAAGSLLIGLYLLVIAQMLKKRL